MPKTTKVVKVPVAILEEDKTIQRIKYRALDKVMHGSLVVFWDTLAA